MLVFLFKKCCSWKYIYYHVFQITIFQHNCIQYCISINIFWASDQHIGMISEGSCDPEDWSNDAENSDLHHMNKLYFKICPNRQERTVSNCDNISQYYCFCSIFDRTNLALFEHKRLLSKHFQKSYQPYNYSPLISVINVVTYYSCT